ncbi:MAG: phosphatase PAP2 family protein [Oscillospiraceae bacterium]|nr:phosphatase PAP2 family protein [Oscillospiraceae bacterium]
MITELDFRILDWIREHLQCGFLDGAMQAVSFLGEAGWVFVLIAVAMLLRKETRPVGLAIAVSLALSLLVCNGVLKNLVARPRPFHLRPETLLIVSPPGEFSFPSGHTSAAFAFAGAMLGMKNRYRWAAMAFGILMGFSRLYLYVHFPTDVIGGVVSGLFCGYLGAFLAKKSGLFSRKPEN